MVGLVGGEAALAPAMIAAGIAAATAPKSAAAEDLCMNSTSILILSCHFMTQNQKLQCSPETFRLSFYGIQGVPKKI